MRLRSLQVREGWRKLSDRVQRTFQGGIAFSDTWCFKNPQKAGARPLFAEEQLTKMERSQQGVAHLYIWPEVFDRAST